MRAESEIQEIRSLIQSHQDWRLNCLNMMASENLSSPVVREALSSDLVHRYAHHKNHDIGERAAGGARYVIEIERMAERIAMKLLGCKYIELRATSGQIASLDVILANTKPGGALMNVSYENGGHGWERFQLDNPVVNYSSRYFVFDMDEWNIDVDKSAKLLRTQQPNLLMLGSSFPLFPQPVKELRGIADEIDAVVAADEAHTLGIILGGAWPNPLDQGAHVMLASTNKSFPGPPHGLLATNDLKQYRSLQKTIVPSLVSNHQVGNTASLAIALAEYAQYGEAYAHKVVRNAKALAASLAHEGFSVIGEKRGYTESHHVLAKTERYMNSWEAMKALDRASIIVNPMNLKGANGVRLGTAELTRRGMGQGEMKEIAVFIRKVIIDKKDPASVEPQVKELTQAFHSISYSVDEGKSPYAPPLTSTSSGKSTPLPRIRK